MLELTGHAEVTLVEPVALSILQSVRLWLLRFSDLLDFILGQHVTSSYLMLEGLVGSYPTYIA